MTEKTGGKMDRHQFVEKLIKERDSLKKEKNELEKKRDFAFQRSMENFRELLRPDQNKWNIEQMTAGTISFCNSSITENILDEKHKVSDDDIKEICGEIAKLKENIKDLESEIYEYEKDDFVGFIGKLMENPN